MEKQHKVTIWYVILGIWMVLILHNLLASAFAIKTIPYSEFLDLVQQGKVTEIAITDNQIQGRLQSEGGGDGQGELFRTIRVDKEINELLANSGVKYTGRIESNFFGNLMSG
jgi:cell division protease FtsH